VVSQANVTALSPGITPRLTSNWYKEWQTEEKLLDVTPLLLDLDGIAPWPPLPAADDRGK
jgi:hypothetical protein